MKHSADTAAEGEPEPPNTDNTAEPSRFDPSIEGAYSTPQRDDLEGTGIEDIAGKSGSDLGIGLVPDTSMSTFVGDAYGLVRDFEVNEPSEGLCELRKHCRAIWVRYDASKREIVFLGVLNAKPLENTKTVKWERVALGPEQRSKLSEVGIGVVGEQIKDAIEPHLPEPAELDRLIKYAEALTAPETLVPKALGVIAEVVALHAMPHVTLGPQCQLSPGVALWSTERYCRWPSDRAISAPPSPEARAGDRSAAYYRSAVGDILRRVQPPSVCCRFTGRSTRPAVERRKLWGSASTSATRTWLPI